MRLRMLDYFICCAIRLEDLMACTEIFNKTALLALDHGRGVF